MVNFDYYLENLVGMFNQSIVEFKYWKDSEANDKQPKVVYLQQAGEKIYCAVQCYLQLKYSVKAEKRIGTEYLAKVNANDDRILKDATTLHRFFYNYLEEPISVMEAENLYKSVKDKLKARIWKDLTRYKLNQYSWMQK